MFGGLFPGGERSGADACRLRLVRLPEHVVSMGEARPPFLVVRVLLEARGQSVDHSADHRLLLFRRHRLGGSHILCGRSGRRRGGFRAALLNLWRNFSETRRHDLAPGRLGRSFGQERTEGNRSCGFVAVLQRGFRTLEPRTGIVSGSGELGLGFRCHAAPGRDHQDLTKLGMQPRLIRRQRDGMAVGVLRLTEALE